MKQHVRLCISLYWYHDAFFFAPKWCKQEHIRNFLQHFSLFHSKCRARFFDLALCRNNPHFPRYNVPSATCRTTSAPTRYGIQSSFTFTEPSAMDKYLIAADTALRTLFAVPIAKHPSPAHGHTEATLDGTQKKLAGALMRVNHVGEVCAQALYTAQAAVTKDPVLRAHLIESAREETDHLAWCRQRLDALGARESVLNPLWFAGAFALGLVAGKIDDRVSLGFVVETETQVAAHLQSHLARLPAEDAASRAVVAQMHDDEVRHAEAARASGAIDLPAPAKALMRMAAKLMTTTAHHI